MQSKLADVQKNDNSSFLPASADSTKVANESQKFNPVQTIPGFIVYQRPSGLTAADKAEDRRATVPKFRAAKGVAGDQVGAAAVQRRRHGRGRVGPAGRQAERQGRQGP